MMFTDMDRAVMAGGHSLEPRAKGMMSFIKELHEARIIQNEADVKITFKEPLQIKGFFITCHQLLFATI